MITKPIELPPIDLAVSRFQIKRAQFWKTTALHAIFWQTAALVALYFSKRVSVGTLLVGVADIAYRILFLRPKEIKSRRSAKNCALRRVDKIDSSSLRRYISLKNIEDAPFAVSFDAFPNLSLVTASEKLILQAKRPISVLNLKDQNLTDEDLATLLFEAQDPLEINLSKNPIKGSTLHAGIGFRTKRMILQNITTLDPIELRKLEVYYQLEEIDLSGSFVNNQTLILGLHQLNRLKALRLDSCKNIEEDSLLRYLFAQRLECLTLIETANINLDVIKNIMEQSSNNRINPLMVVWKEGFSLCMDLSPCSGMQKKQLEWLKKLSLKVDMIRFHGQEFEFYIEWKEFPKTATEVIIKGEGTFPKEAYQSLKCFEWVDTIKIRGFNFVGEEMRKALLLLSDRLDI